MESIRRKKILGGYPAFGVVISTTLALFVLGVFGNLIIYSREFKKVVQGEMDVRVYLKGSLTETQRNQFERTLLSKDYVMSDNQKLEFISKEQAEQELIKQVGDYKSVLGENPYKDAFVLNIKPEFQDTTALKGIKKDLESHSAVLEVDYEEHLFADANRNLRNVSLYLLGIAVLLLVTTVILVNNTLRLALFSQRFLIRSMQLVGAKRWFIQNPFIVRSLLYGILSGVLASSFIWLLSDYAQKTFPEIVVLHNPKDFMTLLVILVATGMVVSCVSTFFAINRYLRMSLDDLY